MAPSSSLELKFDTVDVFTTTRYGGNPLAIVHVPAKTQLTQEQKHTIAIEFNLSETVFLHENPDDPFDRRVDIFTVGGEIPFAGHPTIGTLCHIATSVAPSASTSAIQPIRLNIKAGMISAIFTHTNGLARASIPHDVHFSGLASHDETNSTFFKAFDRDSAPSPCTPAFPVVSPTKGMAFMLVEMPSAEALSALRTSYIGPVTEVYEKRLIEEVKPALLGNYFWWVTDREEAGKESTGTVAIGARMMLDDIPPEDPATGSAACTLASALSTWRRQTGEGGQKGEERVAAREYRPRCADRIKIDPKNDARKDRYEVTQGKDMGRESHITVEVVLNEDNSIKEVHLLGKAVEVMRGTIKV